MKKKTTQPNKIKGIYWREDRQSYWFSKQVDGKRQTFDLHTKDHAEAISKASRILSTLNLEPTENLSNEIDAFLQNRVALNKYTHQTVYTRRYILRKFAEFVHDIAPSKVTVDHAHRYYQAITEKHTPQTALQYMSHCKSLFTWLLARKKIRLNPFSEVELASVDEVTRTKFVEYHDFQRLIATAPFPNLKFILYCGFHCGMRKNEIACARPFWFDLKNRQVTILSERVTLENLRAFRQKDRAAKRIIPLSKEFTRFLSENPQLLEGEFVLRGYQKNHKSLYRYNFVNSFRKHMDAHGFDWVSPHVMRHSFASYLIKSGIDLFTVSEYLGDGTEVVRKHYIHLRPVVKHIDAAFPDDHTFSVVEEQPASDSQPGDARMFNKTVAIQ